jgi:hypothetical protein
MKTPTTTKSNSSREEMNPAEIANGFRHKSIEALCAGMDASAAAEYCGHSISSGIVRPGLSRAPETDGVSAPIQPPSKAIAPALPRSLHASPCASPPVAECDAAAVPKICIGVDNGFTGAVARINHRNEIACAPVPVIDLGKRKYLDRPVVIAQLKAMTQGVENQNVVAVYEHSPITPKFGAINNFVNGQNNEFWRMVLSEMGIPFLWVHPVTWQKHIFTGIRGTDTKSMAKFVCGQRLPHFQPSGYRPCQLLGIYDALCIALWARDTHQ